MAQKAINISANWAAEQELQFSSKKTEIILFTLKRNSELGSLSMNGWKFELSKEARLLGVTLDSKLTWRPHITRITRKAITARVSNRTWTRTVNPNEPFHFGEPEPYLNQQNFTSVNLNQTWTLKILLKWTQTEPEPLTKVRIYFSISGCRWRWYTHNKSSGDHQEDQQYLLFFWTKRVTTVKF